MNCLVACRSNDSQGKPTAVRTSACSCAKAGEDKYSLIHFTLVRICLVRLPNASACYSLAMTRWFGRCVIFIVITQAEICGSDSIVGAVFGFAHSVRVVFGFHYCQICVGRITDFVPNFVDLPKHFVIEPPPK